MRIAASSLVTSAIIAIFEPLCAAAPASVRLGTAAVGEVAPRISKWELPSSMPSKVYSPWDTTNKLKYDLSTTSKPYWDTSAKLPPSQTSSTTKKNWAKATDAKFAGARNRPLGGVSGGSNGGKEMSGSSSESSGRSTGSRSTGSREGTGRETKDEKGSRGRQRTRKLMPHIVETLRLGKNEVHSKPSSRVWKGYM